MQIPAIPHDEVQRIEALKSLDVVYTPAEERFDRLTRLASRALDMPFALVSLVGERTQWFKSAHGMAASESPRELSFCGHAILADETFIVEDASADPRFSDNPAVTSGPMVRAYAGCPVHAQDGSRVGTLCVVDTKPRKFSPEQLEVLRDLAAVVDTELQHNQLGITQRELIRERDDLKRRASVDGLTRLWTREAIMELLNAQIARARRGAKLTVAMVDADHFKGVNDTYGHPAGDAVLVELAKRMRRAVRAYDAVGRYGGEEFIVLLSDCDLGSARTIAERMRRDVSQSTIKIPSAELGLTVSIGLAVYSTETGSLEALVEAADAALYRAKHTGRDCVAY